jgi:hypothetical protein
MSDVGKMLTQVVYVAVAIVALVFFILLATQTRVEECQQVIYSNSVQALGKLRVCVNNCWSKHDFGRSSLNEDCYVINFTSTQPVDSAEAEKILSNPAKVSFLVKVMPNIETALRVRYNSTGVIQIIPY